MAFTILMQFDDNLDNDGIFDGEYPSPSVDSGTAVYSASGSGKAFEVGSAVVDLGTSLFHTGVIAESNLNIELKVDSDATDGIIMACDDLTTDGAAWALILQDMATTPKISLRSWTSVQTSSATNVVINVPTGNGFNNYNYEFNGSTCYYRVNGGSSSVGNFYAAYLTSYWNSDHEFQVWIGKSLYANTPSSNPLSSLTAATGVHIDWVSCSNDNDGYSLNSNTNTDVRSESASSTSSIVGDAVPKTSNGVEVMPSTVIGQLPVAGGGGGGGEVQKEFWS